MIAYAGFFDDLARAQAVVDKFKGEGFPEQEVLLLKPTNDADELKKSIGYARNRDFIVKDATARVRKGLEAGRGVVIVKAGLGSGRKVTSRLEEAGAEMIPEWLGEKRQWFFSDLIGFPLISPKRGTSKGVKAAKPISSSLGMGLIIRPESPRQTSFGLPLTAKPFTLSRMFGMPILARRKTPE